MKPILLALGLLAPMALSASAQAREADPPAPTMPPSSINTASGILSGTQLIWDGTGTNTGVNFENTNQLYIGAGTLLLQGVAVNTSGTQIVTVAGDMIAQTNNFVFDDSIAAGAQGASAIYYVYGAVPGPGVFDWVISLTSPNTDGSPSVNLDWGNLQSPTGDALCVGSYITDSSGNIVPFLKEGDEVILTPTVATSGTNLDTTYSSSITFEPTEAYAELKTITLANVLIPLTASSVIFDFWMGNTDDVYHDLRVINPAFLSLTGGGVQPCLGSSQFYVGVNATDGESERYALYDHVRIKTANNTYAAHSGNMNGGPGTLANVMNMITIGACNQPSPLKVYQLTVAYVGYVEVNHHLSL